MRGTIQTVGRDQTGRVTIEVLTESGDVELLIGTADQFWQGLDPAGLIGQHIDYETSGLKTLTHLRVL